MSSCQGVCRQSCYPIAAGRADGRAGVRHQKQAAPAADTGDGDIQSLSGAARVAPEKCNPRCLRKLYLVTQAEIDRGVRLLAEQAYDRLLDTEQLAVGWDELPEQKKAAQ